MNCQNRVFPPWNRRGGCASKKKARSLRSGADGVVIMVNVDVETLSGIDHPVCAFIRRLRSIFLMAQPPLLSEEGNTLACNSDAAPRLYLRAPDAATPSYFLTSSIVEGSSASVSLATFGLS